MFLLYSQECFRGNRPLVMFIRNYLRDSSGIFSISSLVRISMTLFPALTLLLVQKYSCPYNKKKITRWLEDINFISRGRKQYFTHSLRSFVKSCFYHSKIKSISLRGRVISSLFQRQGITGLESTTKLRYPHRHFKYWAGWGLLNILLPCFLAYLMKRPSLLWFYREVQNTNTWY